MGGAPIHELQRFLVELISKKQCVVGTKELMHTTTNLREREQVRQKACCAASCGASTKSTRDKPGRACLVADGVDGHLVVVVDRDDGSHNFRPLGGKHAAQTQSTRTATHAHAHTHTHTHSQS